VTPLPLCLHCQKPLPQINHTHDEKTGVMAFYCPWCKTCLSVQYVPPSKKQ
jgi:hypothetical protein